MCLSSAYLINGDSETLVMEKVASFSQHDREVVLVDLMGRQEVVSGHIESADLIANKISITR